MQDRRRGGEVSSLGRTTLVLLRRRLGEEGLRSFCGVITRMCRRGGLLGDCLATRSLRSAWMRAQDVLLLLVSNDHSHQQAQHEMHAVLNRAI
jgi:hypothetical protein